jgi:hypothetical protein
MRKLACGKIVINMGVNSSKQKIKIKIKKSN